MKAAVLREVGKPLQIEDVQISKPGPHEVLIRTAAAGVCHSDLHFIEGSYPHPLPAVLGHESAGIVEQVGSEVRTVKPGDHVITCLSAFCGHCEFCLTGHMSLCVSPETKRGKDDEPRLLGRRRPMMQYLNLSSFAEQMLIHEHACVAIRPDMPLDRAALIGCAVMTGVGAAIHTSNVRPGETVAVIGCGGVGLSAINGAAIAGASRIIAIDTVASKGNLAKEFGATDFIDAARRRRGEGGDRDDQGRRAPRLRGHRPGQDRRAGLQHAAPRRHGQHHRHDPGRPDRQPDGRGLPGREDASRAR